MFFFCPSMQVELTKCQFTFRKERQFFFFFQSTFKRGKEQCQEVWWVKSISFQEDELSFYPFFLVKVSSINTFSFVETMFPEQFCQPWMSIFPSLPPPPPPRNPTPHNTCSIVLESMPQNYTPPSCCSPTISPSSFRPVFLPLCPPSFRIYSPSHSFV